MDKKFNYEEFIKSFNVIGVVEDKILFEVLELYNKINKKNQK